ncbi:hypothetical protein ACVW07_002771 [Cellulomonas sp. URHB0016]
MLNGASQLDQDLTTPFFGADHAGPDASPGAKDD